MSFFSRKKHQNQPSNNVNIVQSPSQALQQVGASSQQPSQQVAKQSSYDKSVFTSTPRSSSHLSHMRFPFLQRLSQWLPFYIVLNSEQPQSRAADGSHATSTTTAAAKRCQSSHHWHSTAATTSPANLPMVPAQTQFEPSSHSAETRSCPAPDPIAFAVPKIWTCPPLHCDRLWRTFPIWWPRT